MAFCEKCGNQIGPDAAFCARCGVSAGTLSRQVPTYVANTPVQQRSRRSPVRSLLWIGGGSFVVLLLIVFAQSGKSSPEPSTQAAAPAIDVGAMRAVMQRDNELGSAVNAAIGKANVTTDEDLDRIATLMRNYVADARQIDTHSCPRDFAEIYYRHLSAWSDQADAVSAHPHIPVGSEAFIEGFFRGLNGDLSGGVIQRQDDFKAWLEQVKARDADIHRTWEEVEALAVRYGAR